MLTLDTMIVRKDDFLGAALGEETVLMSLEGGTYFALKATSHAIWERLANPVRVRDLCTELADAYQAPLETVETDTLAFLDHLETEKMIERLSE